MNNQRRGFERCLRLEPMTGILIRGTWPKDNNGSSLDFATGSCNSNQ